jgi:hypothetical protein
MISFMRREHSNAARRSGADRSFLDEDEQERFSVVLDVVTSPSVFAQALAFFARGPIAS